MPSNITHVYNSGQPSGRNVVSQLGVLEKDGHTEDWSKTTLALTGLDLIQ